MAELRINTDELNDLVIAVEELGKATESDDVRRVMGMAMYEVIRSHFADIAQDSLHHKTSQRLGASPTGVYEEARSRTDEPVVDANGITVTIHQVAVAQRYYGGPITPKNVNWLTIPARSETYGKRAREFDNLSFILFPSGIGALVDKSEKSKRDSVYFWLVKHVDQPADPTVLPDEETIIDEAMKRAESYITRVWDENPLPKK